MSLPRSLRELLARDERRRLKPYRDTAGKLTIGFGRNLDDRGISAVEADFLLSNDIRSATVEAMERLPWALGLDEPRRAVLISLVFNMGGQRLVDANPRFLAACERGDWDTAHDELLGGPYEHEVGDRARRLALQIKTGAWT